MILKRFSHLLIVWTLLVSVILAPLQSVSLAQTQAQATAAKAVPAASSYLSARLAAIEKALDEKRKEYHIPGVSLVIVKDDRVIYMKGLGLKDVACNLPVTP